MRPLSEQFKRILVTRVDRIGDVLLSTPVLEALRRRFPGARITVMVRPATREIVEGNPFVDEVLLYDKDGAQRSLWATAAFAARLRKEKFDLAVNLHPTSRVHWISALAGIPVRIGYTKKAAWLLTHPVPEEKRWGIKHEARYNFDLLRGLGITEPAELNLHFSLTERDREEFLELAGGWDWPALEPYAVLNPSASCPSKIWPAEKFALLGDELWDRYQLRTVLISSKEDARHTQEVKRLMRQEPVDLTGKLNLKQLAACLKNARLLVSNDSGPVHLAVAVGTPVLSIFGRNESGLTATRWGPVGARSAVIQKDVGCYFCLAHNCRIGFLCLQALKVEEVLDAVRKMEPMFAAL